MQNSPFLTAGSAVSLEEPPIDPSMEEAAILLRSGDEGGALQWLELSFAALPEGSHTRAARQLATDFVALLLRGVKPGMQFERGATNPFFAVLRLVERFPWLVADDHLWLDRDLRINRDLALPTRIGIWAIALAQRPGLAQTLSLMTLADNARALDLYSRCADWLRTLLEAQPDLPADEAGPAWCKVGDASLLRNDPATAEVFYRQALARQPESGRAQLGLACVALDQGKMVDAAGRGRQAADLFDTAGLKETADVTRQVTALWAATRPLEKVEVVIFCHVSNKLKQNTHLGGPGLGLLELGLSSLRQMLQLGAEIPITVYYDHRPSEINNAFLSNLARFCIEQKLHLAVYTQNGLRRQWLQAFARSEADALLIIEQDHEFFAPCPTLEAIRTLLISRPDISQLRLNRRRNKKVGVDTMLLQTRRDKRSEICRTAGFSNTPQLLRRDFYDAVVFPAIADRPLHDHRNFGAAGVEENMNNLIRRIEPHIGMTSVQRLLGLAVWGRMKEEQVCVHTGV